MYSISFPEMLNSTTIRLLKDHEAVRSNLKLILSSEKLSHFGDPYFGSRLKRALFEQPSHLIVDLMVDEIYTTIITYPPVFYLSTATMSKLAVKKYIEQNIDGQTVELDVKLESIDENKNPITGKVEKYAYKAVGQLGSYSVYIYSNNDKLVSAKIGSDYTVKGTVSIDYLDMLNNPWIYKVNEE